MQKMILWVIHSLSPTRNSSQLTDAPGWYQSRNNWIERYGASLWYVFFLKTQNCFSKLTLSFSFSLEWWCIGAWSYCLWWSQWGTWQFSINHPFHIGLFIMFIEYITQCLSDTGSHKCSTRRCEWQQTHISQFFIWHYGPRSKSNIFKLIIVLSYWFISFLL